MRSSVVFIIVGMIVGGLSGNFGVAILGGIVGFALSRWLASANAESPEAASDLDELRNEVRHLREEVTRLTRRIDHLSTGAPESIEPVASEPEPDLAEATPKPVVEPTPVVVFLMAEEVVAPVEVLRAPKEEERSNIEFSPELPPEFSSDFPETEDLPIIETTPRFDPFTIAKNWLFGGNALVRVGVVILFFGLAFLVKFAAEHAVFPVEARYIAIGIGALVALGLGWRLRLSRPDYAMALQGLAVASLYLATFAAFRLHSLLPAGVTIAILTATCVLSAALAVLQNARAMAVIGICGGFLAPVLASTGGGSHVALFSYYALLNLGIVGIAWFKAWRPLNVLGFFFTFGIASLWASRNYRDELFASTEPFLIGFFILYLLVSLLYAKRRKAEAASLAVEVGGERIDYVDGTLVFGNPLVAFGLQYLMVKDMAYGSAFSALGLGLIYLPLATLLYRRGREEFRLMVESFLALGVIFASLAIPLGLDAKWTSAAWAAEGAGIFWVGLRQQRPAARAFALLLQFGSAISLVASLEQAHAQNWLGLIPVFDGSLLGPIFVGLAALFTARIMARQADQLREWEAALAPALVVAGLGFLNFAFPMFLDQSWSGLAWAVSGAIIVWLAQGRDHTAATLFGVLLQFVGGVAFGSSISSNTATPLLNRFWIGSIVVASAGLVSGWRVNRAGGEIARLSVLGLVWGLLWWSGAGLEEISNHVVYFRCLAFDIGFATLTALMLLMAGRTSRWQSAEAASLLLLPALAVCAGLALLEKAHPAIDGGWLAWPLALLVMAWALHRQEDNVSTKLLGTGHTFALWLITGLATWQCWWGFHELGDPLATWPILGWALAPIAVLALLNGGWLRTRWPLTKFAPTYGWSTIPIAASLWFWVFVANTVSDGNASPLPYLPIANPIDLATAGALLTILTWLRRWHANSGVAPTVKIGLAATTFYWLNSALLRTLHHWAGVPFDFDAMMQSMLVQASLSLFWSSLALVMMLFATRRQMRKLWLVGGVLLAIVVAKLFMVDLSNVGAIERIVSFIGVGVLLLVIGYFSPVPPKKMEGA
jgi:uncharacterized membrane protein